MGTLLWSTVGGALAFLLWKTVNFIVRPYLSPLRSLPGPPSPSWLWGQMKRMVEIGDDQLVEKWLEQYGKNIVTNGILNVWLLTHIFNQFN